MILKSLKVERFGGLNPGALVGSFGPDITVIHGPNGIGKSTLFRALSYALYQRHGVGGHDVSAQIVPRGCDLAPRVSVTFEVQGATWRLAKQFIKKADTELCRLENGVFVPKAQGSTAEDLLRDLLGSGRNQKGLAGAQFRGIGEVLLVDQGQIRMSEVSQFARDRLRVVIDQVATTQGAHEVLAAVEKRYSEVFGKTGVRETSALSRLEEDIGRLDHARDEVQAQIALAEDLGQRLAALAGDSPARVTEEIARIERELDAANGRKVEVATRRAERDALVREARTLTEDADRLEAVCAGLVLNRAAAERLSKSIVPGESRHLELTEAQARAAAAERAAEEDLGRALGQDRLLSGRERAARDARKAFEVAGALPDLEDRVARHAAACERIAEAEKKSAGRLRPTQKEIVQIRAAFQALHDLERAAQLSDFRIAVTAESAITLESGAGRIALEPNETREAVSDGSHELRIPGVARIGIRAPAGVERSRILKDLDAARHAAEDLGTRFGAPDLEGLEALARERVEIEAGLQALTMGRDALFKDEKKAQGARVELNAARATLAELLERRGEWKGAVPDLPAIAREEHDLEKERQHAGDAQTSCAKLLESRRDVASRAAEDLKLHDQTLSGWKMDLAGATGRIAALESDRLSDEERSKRVAEATERRRTVERDLAATTEALDVLGDPDASIGRLVAERREIQTQEKLTEETRIRLSEQLDQLRDKGLWQTLADAEIERERKALDLERERLDADALQLLRESLVREQASAVEAAVRPVADKVSRMARFLFGSKTSATINEGLTPQALLSEGSDLPVGLLSAGTQDQLALLARMALGELYAEKQGRHAFVLDDPLVNCDRERRGRILELLGASRSLQIVIFTCSPELYAGLPAGKAVFVSMEDAKKQISRQASLSA